MSHASAQPQDLFQLAAVTPAELAAIATAAAGSPVARPVAHPAPIAYDWGCIRLTRLMLDLAREV